MTEWRLRIRLTSRHDADFGAPTPPAADTVLLAIEEPAANGALPVLALEDGAALHLEI